MATKVYTSAEFKRERDNFLSLCKNLERAETKKWLSEVFLWFKKNLKSEFDSEFNSFVKFSQNLLHFTVITNMK